MARRPRGKRRPRPASTRHYPRTARLNTLLQRIVADYLELVDDDRLGLVTVTGVEVDADLNRAQVFISALADESDDSKVLAALADYRKAIQSEIAGSARLRKTPEVAFSFDPAVRAGARIEDILSSLRLQDPVDGDPDGDPDGDLDGGGDTAGNGER
jgi:ribosome-binding factor A